MGGESFSYKGEYNMNLWNNKSSIQVPQDTVYVQRDSKDKHVFHVKQYQKGFTTPTYKDSTLYSFLSLDTATALADKVNGK